MIGRKTLLILITVLSILLSGCTQKNNEAAVQKGSTVTTAVPTGEPSSQDNNETGDEEAVKSNKELILDILDIRDNVAQGIADELAALKLGEMVSAEIVENDGEVYTLCMKDKDDEKYYITTDMRGYLGIIRKGSETGTILYAPVD